jgi:23S rRNA (cytosine1962-C5)-methyltransferase
MVRRSVYRRSSFFVPDSPTNTFRIIHGEADFLPGVAADVYAQSIRIIISARPAFENRKAIVDELFSLLKPQCIVLSTDPSFCGIERMKEVTEVYPEGAVAGEIMVRESSIRYSVNLLGGQKSGFFCDQRENRNRFERYVKDQTVLDLCCYSGAFSLHALRGGAQYVDSVDASQDALDNLAKNLELNPELNTSRLKMTKADMFEYLRSMPRNKYSVIVLDPPKLAKTSKALEEAKKGYKDLNRVAMEKIKDGGILVTCSCSGALTREDFRTVISWAAKDAGVEAQVLETLGQAEDHPIRLAFPESEYLKVFILRVLK